MKRYMSKYKNIKRKESLKWCIDLVFEGVSLIRESKSDMGVIKNKCDQSTSMSTIKDKMIQNCNCTRVQDSLEYNCTRYFGILMWKR